MNKLLISVVVIIFLVSGYFFLIMSEQKKKVFLGLLADKAQKIFKTQELADSKGKTGVRAEDFDPNALLRKRDACNRSLDNVCENNARQELKRACRAKNLRACEIIAWENMKIVNCPASPATCARILQSTKVNEEQLQYILFHACNNRNAYGCYGLVVLYMKQMQKKNAKSRLRDLRYSSLMEAEEKYLERACKRDSSFEECTTGLNQGNLIAPKNLEGIANKCAQGNLASCIQYAKEQKTKGEHQTPSCDSQIEARLADNKERESFFNKYCHNDGKTSSCYGAMLAHKRLKGEESAKKKV